LLGSQLRNALKHDSDSSSDDEKKCTQPQEHSHEEAKSHHGHADGLSRIDLKPLGAQITASHSVKNGGGTGKELPANLLNPGEEGWNKWCEIDSKTARVFVKLNNGQPVAAQIYDFKNEPPDFDLSKKYQDQLESYRTAAAKLLGLDLTQVSATAISVQSSTQKPTLP